MELDPDLEAGGKIEIRRQRHLQPELPDDQVRQRKLDGEQEQEDPEEPPPQVAGPAVQGERREDQAEQHHEASNRRLGPVDGHPGGHLESEALLSPPDAETHRDVADERRRREVVVFVL